MPGLRDYPFRISYGPGDDRLHDFYLPALERSARYDRSAGFFSSSALAVAAAGIARLIRNGGRMRLLVGAQLEPADVEAIVAGEELAAVVRQRLLAGLSTPEDELLRDRLAALAWMVAEGTLEIRVVLPCDATGRPLPADAAAPYFHVKEGVFTDRYGDRVAFSGSVNESALGWQHNYEQFSVYFSWDSTRPYLEQVVWRFERLWRGEEQGWLAVPLPDAVRQALLVYRPERPPACDPLERIPAPVPVAEARGSYVTEEAVPRTALLARFLRDAPQLVGTSGVGFATAAIEPWPHQLRVAQALCERFPERFLLADEVGLGKTIEVGLALRELVLTGRVRRALLLVPASVLRQWQEELYEKFALAVPRYEDGRLWSVRGESREAAAPNPFASEPLLLVSSQLAKRRDRLQQVLEAGPWDVVVVDEAHHARRHGSEGGPERPNRLLSLLRELSPRTRALWLLSATPMQLHPVELWDLLSLLGLGGSWGAGPEPFLRFFTEIRRGPGDVEWSVVLPLVREEVARSGVDAALAAQGEAALGLLGWERVRAVLLGNATPHLLTEHQRAYLYRVVRQHTPLRRLMFRHTRQLLRQYARRGLLDARIPEREPQPVWIEMTASERDLYERIEEYIAEFYARFEAERRGLGFVMSIYRRRLTSSFHAVRCSLERRLAYLERRRRDLGLADEDVEQVDLERDLAEELGEVLEVPALQEEIAYVRDFVRELERLGDDSKLSALQSALSDLFRRYETVAVFTQYTDTMDYLRDRLREVYGSSVACYSGRGGEVWRDGAWQPVSKEEIKNGFRDGRIAILVCTDAASEGLNLQTCGALVNYDLPWNPMRVEQRIGRFDRIGQRYPTVRILNFFYAGTIEAEIYRRLGDRIDWFRTVVGELQPILGQVERLIERVALQPRRQRQPELTRELAALEQQLERAERPLVELEMEPELSLLGQLGDVPVRLEDLARLVPTLPGLAERFRPHPEIEGAWLVSWRDRLHAVTFDRAVFDRHSDTLQFLTYGNPLLTELLETIDPPEGRGALPVLRLERAGDPPLCGYYQLDGEQAVWLGSVAAVEDAVAAPGAASAAAREAAQRDFAERCARVMQRWRQQVAWVGALLRSQLEGRARRVLVEAALVEVALGQRPELFGQSYPQSFGPQAVHGLLRHGYPFAPLLRLVGQAGLEARADDPLWADIERLSVEQLRARWRRLIVEAEHLVHALAVAPDAAAPR